MKAELYTCAVCRGTFEKTRSDEEAAAECRDLTGIDPLNPEDLPCETVCDDCFKKLGIGNVV